jgi:hypothetical protein
LAVLVALSLVFQFASVAHTPFLSEDWTHLEEMRPVTSFFAALDPRVEPLRPFQHAFFWVLGHCGADPAGAGLPFAAHAFAFALHVASCVLVYLLAREAGLRGGGPWMAAALFAVFPNVKAIAWSAAIGNPGRVCFELAALLALVRHLDLPRARRGAFALVAFVLALCWHESAMILPAIFVLWIVFVSGETWREGLVKLRAAARDPWLCAFFVASLLYVVYLFLRPERHHGAKSLDSLPANLVKATTALLPEDLRTLIVDGFRTHGGASFVLAAVLFAGLVIAALYCAWRSRCARFVLFAVAVELFLPALGAGFVQRYAYFASALVAIGLAVWIVNRGGAARWIILFWLGGMWFRDAWADARDFHTLGHRIPRWIQDWRDARAEVGAGVPIAIVNPTDMYGAEADIPLFNWGLDYMLAAHHVPGPWLLWRTHPYHTSTNVELVDEARVLAARRANSPILYEFPADSAR